MISIISDKDETREIVDKITFMRGSNGNYVLPDLIKTNYEICPSGILLSREIVPMGGELKQGLNDNGVNWEDLSGMQMDSEGLQKCWRYAAQNWQDNLKIEKIEEKYKIGFEDSIERSLSTLKNIIGEKRRVKLMYVLSPTLAAWQLRNIDSQ